MPQAEGEKAGQIMTQTATPFDYAKKRAGVAFAEILAPDGAPDWAKDRQELWNRVENSEKRVDSQLARHIDVALPRELDLDQCKALARGFIAEAFTSKGMIADYAFHDIGKGNPHMHVMLTLREIEGDGFAAKKCAAWQPRVAAKGGKGFVAEHGMDEERQCWETHCNRALAAAESGERVDRRTLAAQGVARKPTFHIGKDAWHRERRGGLTEIGGRFRNVAFFNAAAEKLRAFQARVQARPFYRLPVLAKARAYLHELFEDDRSAQAPPWGAVWGETQDYQRSFQPKGYER